MGWALSLRLAPAGTRPTLRLLPEAFGDGRRRFLDSKDRLFNLDVTPLIPCDSHAAEGCLLVVENGRRHAVHAGVELAQRDVVAVLLDLTQCCPELFPCAAEPSVLYFAALPRIDGFQSIMRQVSQDDF